MESPPGTHQHQLNHHFGVGDVGAAHGGPPHTGALLGVHTGHSIWGTETNGMLETPDKVEASSEPLHPLHAPSQWADIDPLPWP